VYSSLAERSSEGGRCYNAPCWENGYWDGTDNNGWMRPLIIRVGGGECGGAPNMRIAHHYCSGSAGTCDFNRVYYEHCGYVLICEEWLTTSVNECKFASKVKAEPVFADHWHYHHYNCVFI
jgi:hypothetical protein